MLTVRPWYDVDFTHAGGGDHHFQNHWSWGQKRMLPFNVLHLGPRDNNWFGRHSARLDGDQLPAEVAERRRGDMESLLHTHGWCGRSKNGTKIQEKIR